MLESSLVSRADFGDSEVDRTGDAQVLHHSLAGDVGPVSPQLLG